MSHYVHHVPGRIRIKTPHLKRNRSRAAEVQALLDAHEGIISREINILTGSVVIGYDKEITSAEQIMAAMKDNHHLANEARINKVASNGKTAHTVSTVGDNLAKVVVGFVVEKALERSATALIGALL
jgi:hypothetical protein